MSITNFRIIKSHNKMEQLTKRVNVWDTYVTKKDGTIMHLDILVPIEIQNTKIVYHYGGEYLKTKEQDGQALTSHQCRLCHMENLKSSWEKEIIEKGYFIIEMEGCN